MDYNATFLNYLANQYKPPTTEDVARGVIEDLVDKRGFDVSIYTVESDVSTVIVDFSNKQSGEGSVTKNGESLVFGNSNLIEDTKESKENVNEVD